MYVLDDTRRIFSNLFLFPSFPRYFRVFSSEISFRYLTFFFFFFDSAAFDEDQFYTQNLANLERWADISFFKVETKLQSLMRTFRGWQKLRKKKEKKGTKNSSNSLFTLRKLLKIWQLPGRVPGRWRPVGSLRGRIQFSPRSHENSRNLLDPTCVRGCASSLVRRTV